LTLQNDTALFLELYMYSMIHLMKLVIHYKLMISNIYI
jgi:hypothetical protein